MAEDFSRSPQVLQAVGFLLEAYDGGLNPFQYWGDKPIPGVHCPACYSPLDLETLSERLGIRGRRHSYLADGHMIVSERFRDFLRSAGYVDVDFPCLDTRRRLYELRPSRILEVDLELSEPLFGDVCLRCGNFEGYHRGRGVFLYDITKPLQDGIYRTDLLVGSRMGKHYDIIVAPPTKEKILQAGFTEVRFRALPDLDPDFEKRRENSLRTGARWRRKERAIRRLQRMRAKKGCISAGQAITKPFRA